MKKILHLGSAIIAIALVSFINSSSVKAEVKTPVPEKDGIVKCFDYYRFGSVQTSFTASRPNALAGSELEFSGVIYNDNDYPIVDAEVYVKIFRTSGSDGVKANGYDQVDQFVAVSKLNLPARSSVGASFKWKVPSYAVSGNYTVASYVSSAKAFNLLGLSFTDDIIGNYTPFQVTGQQKYDISFNRSSAKVADQSFSFAAFIPEVSSTSPITVSIDLDNGFTTDKNVTVRSNIYWWDGLKEEHLISTKTEQVSIKAKSSKKLSYTVTDKTYPVYYVVIEAEYNGAKSIADIRFSREGLDRTRINFPAVGSYPLKAGEPVALFSCLHNSGTSSIVPNGKLVLGISDANGNEVTSYTYTGKVSSSMMAAAQAFTPKNDLSNFTVSADLYSGGKLVDSARMTYDCNVLDPSACPVAVSSWVSVGITFAIIILALAILFIIMHIHNHVPQVPRNKGHMKLVVLIAIALISGGTLFYVGGKVKASDGYAYNLNVTGSKFNPISNPAIYSTTLSKSVTPSVHWCNNDDCVDYLTGMQLQAIFGVDVLVNGTKVIPNPTTGVTVKVGDTVSLAPAPHTSTDASWFIMMAHYDSPYAYWSTGPASVPCTPSDMFAAGNYYNMFMRPVITPGSLTTTVSGSGTTILSGSGNFVAQAVGSTSIKATFGPSTVTTYIDQYKGGKCYPNANLMPAPVVNTVSTTTYTLQANYNKITTNTSVTSAGTVTVVTKATGVEKFKPYRFIMSTTTETTTVPTGFTAIQKFGNESWVSPYIFTLDGSVIPISVPINVVAGDNNPPNPPTGLHTTGGALCANASIGFTFTPATVADPDGDSVTYQYSVTTDSSGTWSAPQNIGSVTTFNQTWIAPGTYSVRVQAVDSRGGVSAWVNASPVVVTDCSLPPVTPPGGAGAFSGRCDVASQTPVAAPGVGDTVVFQIAGLTGTAPYTYPSGWSATGSKSVVYTAGNSGPSVMVTDSTGGVSSQISCPSVSVSGTGVPLVVDIGIFAHKRLNSTGSTTILAAEGTPIYLTWNSGLDGADYACESSRTLPNGSTWNDSAWSQGSVKPVKSPAYLQIADASANKLSLGTYYFTITCKEKVPVTFTEYSSTAMVKILTVNAQEL